MKESLELFGVTNVAFCIDGETAIETCKSILDVAIQTTTESSIKPIDLVLTDYRMPYKNGIEVITEVRRYFDLMRAVYPSIEILNPRFAINTAYKSPEL